jgi:hypothetical protein
MPKGIYWLRSKKLFMQIKSSGILLIPVALYFIPLDWLEKQHSICLYKYLTGNECYGCGTTRAILSALHFHFNDAYNFNKLFILLLPVLIYLWIKLLKEMITELKTV